jgi:ABC-type multidrug transport system permease subunit
MASNMIMTAIRYAFVSASIAGAIIAMLLSVGNGNGNGNDNGGYLLIFIPLIAAAAAVLFGCVGLIRGFFKDRHSLTTSVTVTLLMVIGSVAPWPLLGLYMGLIHLP